MNAEQLGNITLYNADCIEFIQTMGDESVDVILTDPPYLYLKNQKLDVPFDEQVLFSECKRVLKKDGFIVLFGRGTSFYRWNTMLADLGFEFKEEIIWNKSHITSPLLPISRIHETVSIHTNGTGKINKVKVPYLEMKRHDVPSIIQDIKRMRAILKNTKSLNAVLDFLENNQVSVSDGMNEKSIIRTDKVDFDAFSKFGVTADKIKSGDKACNVIQSITVGMNERTIIKEIRDHYSAIHPTQKPVRLLERLLALVIPENKSRNEITVFDPFGGSFSTMEAVYNMNLKGIYNMNLKGISCEIDKEFFEAGKKRVYSLIQQPKLF